MTSESRTKVPLWRAGTVSGVLTTVLAVVAAILPATPATAARDGQGTPVACGDTLTSGVILTTDLTCDGDGLLIGADDVTVNLAGHTLGGPGYGVGVTLQGHKGVTVKNGVITGFGTASVHADQGASVTLSRVRISGTRLTGDDATVTVTGSPDTCAVDGGYFRFTLLTIDRCTVHGSITTITGRTFVRSSRLSKGGLGLYTGYNGAITGNVFDEFTLDLATDSSNNHVKGNLFKNTYQALRVDKTDYSPNIVEDNVFRRNGIGLLSGRGFRNVIVRRNLFADNTTAGILIQSSSPSPEFHPVADNVLLRNGREPNGMVDYGGNPVQGGIHVFTYTPPKGPPGPGPEPGSPTPITLTGNTGRGNAGFLIWGKQGHVIDGGGNQGPCGPQPGSGLTCD